MTIEVKRNGEKVSIPFGVKVFLGFTGLLVLALLVLAAVGAGGFLATL